MTSDARALALLPLWLMIFIPRLIWPDQFFIQDEQPWLNRSQIYTNALLAGDLVAAAKYPLSNHPAITLMTVVGPTLNTYARYHSLSGTYESWSGYHKITSAAWARWVWGIVCSLALSGILLMASRLAYFKDRLWLAAALAVWLGLEPWIWGVSRTVSADVMMAIALVASFIAAGWARQQRKWWLFSLSGAWWGLAFISKSPALITLPIVVLFCALQPPSHLKTSLRRIGWWLAGAYLAMAVIWPSFLVSPWQRLTDVLARAELHAGAPEVYLWPGIHPPFFLVTLSVLSFLGCIVYIILRIWHVKSGRRDLHVFDALLAAAVFHGTVLLYVAGDHARKNLPVLALLAVVGFAGWVELLRKLKIKFWAISALILLQLFIGGIFFPHLITSHNILFSTVASRRLLVDVGNGSRLAADYINGLSSGEVVAAPMDSLIQPYLDDEHQLVLRPYSPSGRLDDLPPEVSYLFVPASLPARINFDNQAKNILADLESKKPKALLSIRSVPIFFVYQLK